MKHGDHLEGWAIKSSTGRLRVWWLLPVLVNGCLLFVICVGGGHKGRLVDASVVRGGN